MTMHYQQELHKLVLEKKPRIIVETGVQTGVSTRNIIKALDEIGNGFLFSIDPYAKSPMIHPRLEFMQGTSVEMMPIIYSKTGPWDFFLHDSDHAVGCMAFELELAWHFVRPGGVIACDDYDWGTHRAFFCFIERHNLSPYKLFGAAAYIIKGNEAATQIPDAAFSMAVDVANESCNQNGKRPYYPLITDGSYVVDRG